MISYKVRHADLPDGWDASVVYWLGDPKTGKVLAVALYTTRGDGGA